MKIFFIGLAAMIVLWALACLPRPSAAPRSAVSSQEKRESPFACNRFGLTAVERIRHFAVLGPTLRSLRTGVRELPDGYEFQFASDRTTSQLLAEWSIQERLCCPFFDIELRWEREGGPVWLRLTGREGTKKFIQAELPAGWLKE